MASIKKHNNVFGVLYRIHVCPEMGLWWDAVNTVLNIRKRLEETIVNLELSSMELVTYFVIAFIYLQRQQTVNFKIV